MRPTLVALALAVPLAAGPLAPAGAQESKTIGTFDDWAAYAAGEGRAKICYMHAVPQTSEGDYTQRGATFVQISHRPAEKAFNVVNVTAGYTYKQGGEVEAEVDGNKHTLFTHGDGAWARDAKADAALIAAMKAGNAMVVRGTSARGTLTIDTYSLKGFSAAHAAIDKACGR